MNLTKQQEAGSINERPKDKTIAQSDPANNGQQHQSQGQPHQDYRCNSEKHQVVRDACLQQIDIRKNRPAIEREALQTGMEIESIDGTVVEIAHVRSIGEK